VCALCDGRDLANKKDDSVVVNRSRALVIQDAKGRERECFRDILDGQTVHEQVDESTGMSAQVIIGRATIRSSDEVVDKFRLA
jgi:hypothetical protein